MSEEQVPFTDLDRVIHEPARLLIVTILSTVEQADFLFLLRETGLTKGNLSSHLARLEKNGYIVVEKTYKGKVPMTLCSLTGEGQRAFQQYLQQLDDLLARGQG
jgi:DNA-binding MarR family transcriptional regulator